ncbi:cilia- and flagella-associated protein 107-like [Carassius gibelio]|uniref:cilia- and flagella-associated protein 107-like n=1 Tax=Carassius gibelio TaxID=101364 RepID=UPI00227835C7|nr:cilia- and flagella-associated protein 107-like [Carassius gibelio]
MSQPCKYSNKVLIGNWAEERLHFTQDCEMANSSYRMDYMPHMPHRPDAVMCQRAFRRSEGLPLRQLFSHHGLLSSHCLVSQYDESYGRQASSSLPTLHSWSSFKLARVPERSDHPIQGIKHSLDSRWVLMQFSLRFELMLENILVNGYGYQLY